VIYGVRIQFGDMSEEEQGIAREYMQTRFAEKLGSALRS